MKHMLNKILTGLFLLFFISSNIGDKTVQTFEENYNKLQPFWHTEEIVDGSRYTIVKDPINPKNKSLLLSLYPEDFIGGSKRNEFRITTKDTIGLTVEYTFTFYSQNLFSLKKERQIG